MLVLSKRLHSIFLLRLFNDCFVVLALFLTIYCLQRRQWKLGSQVFSLGVGIKMSLVLAAPGVGVVLLQAVGFAVALNLVFLMAKLQVYLPLHVLGQFQANIRMSQFVLSVPFVLENWRGYLSRSFQLNRVFLYKWTVNFRFVPQQVFLAPGFSILLLQLHAYLLLVFLTGRWLILRRIIPNINTKTQFRFYLTNDNSDKAST